METTKPNICKCGEEIKISIYETKSGVKTYTPKYCSRKCAYSLRVRPTGLEYNIVAINKSWFPKGSTPHNLGIPTSVVTKEKIREKLLGKRNSIRTEFKYTNGLGYRHLLVKGLLKQQCECGEDNLHRLHIHHIDKNRLNNDIDNLQVLCRPCHLSEHNKVERSYVLGRKTLCKNN